jgi:hypothetical protein
LSVLAAAQPGDGDPHDDLPVPLTRNEICKLLTGLSRQLAAPAIQLHWSDGDADIRPPPEPATTADEPSHPHDHEMSLEYQAGVNRPAASSYLLHDGETSRDLPQTSDRASTQVT